MMEPSHPRLSCIRKVMYRKYPTLISLVWHSFVSKLISGACQFPIKGIYFLIPGRELSNGLKEIKDDNDLAEFVALGFKNKKEIDLYMEHHGYDLSHWLQNEIGPDEVSDDDEIGEMEDIKGHGYDDTVGEEDIEIPGVY